MLRGKIALADSYEIVHIPEIIHEHAGSSEQYFQMLSMLEAWQELKKLEAGEISGDAYDRWRYRYPEFDTANIWAKVPSDQLSRALAKNFRKQ